MPTTLEKFASKGISVNPEDKMRIERLEKYGLWMLYFLLTTICWLFWSIIAPHSVGAWKLPAVIGLVELAIWWAFSAKLGYLIMRYEKQG